MARRRTYKKRRPRLPSWRKIRGRFQLRRKVRNLALSWLVVLSTGVILFFFYLFWTLRTPWTQAQGFSALSWDGERPLIVVLISKNTSLLCLNPERKGAFLIPLFDKAKDPEKIIPQLAKDLALPIDGYVRVGEERADWKKIEEALSLTRVLSSLRHPGRIPAFLSNSLQTNLSPGTLARGAFFLWRLPPGGKKSGFQRDLVSDLRMEEEGTRVLVLNGTGSPRLAARCARWIENLGGYVVDTGNVETREKSIILVPKEGSYTARRLGGALGIRVRKLEAGKWKLERQFERADIVVVLGLDKADSF